MVPMKIKGSELLIDVSYSHNEDPFTVDTCVNCSELIFMKNGKSTCHCHGYYDIRCDGRI